MTLKFEFHPLANVFPLIEGAEFDELVADIKANGLNQCIELYEGKILDGRNRYRACLAAGVEPLAVQYRGVRNQHELLLVATRGDMPSPSPANRPPSVISAPRREHSRKPDEAYALIEAMYPALPRLELFGRQRRPGWDVWGNETDKFTADKSRGDQRRHHLGAPIPR
jgi:hypothetical protein